MFLATLPGLVFAFTTMTVVGWVLSAPSALYGLVSTVIGGGGALLLYAICAKLLSINEFTVLAGSVAGRLGRLRSRGPDHLRVWVVDRPQQRQERRSRRDRRSVHHCADEDDH
jgi:hypothetical protein